MQFDWRAISGPALTVATTVIAVVIDRHFVTVPSPAPLFICIVAFAASFSGLASGMASAAVAVGGAALFFSSTTMPHLATRQPILARLLLLAMTAAGTAAVAGLLLKKLMDAFALERRHYATAARLSAALDQVDIGIVLLNSDTRAEFINRAFRDYFALPDQKADSKPPFIALMSRHRRL